MTELDLLAAELEQQIKNLNAICRSATDEKQQVQHKLDCLSVVSTCVAEMPYKPDPVADELKKSAAPNPAFAGPHYKAIIELLFEYKPGQSAFAADIVTYLKEDHDIKCTPQGVAQWLQRLISVGKVEIAGKKSGKTLYAAVQ